MTKPRGQATQETELLSRFESLGDNCEFGMVQRAHGVARGGLLRWARSLSIRRVIALLEARCEGLFALDNLQPCDGVMVLDRAWGVQFHTALRTEWRDGQWVSPLGAAEQRAVLAREQARVRELARRLIEDLTKAERVFVYKSNAPAAEDDIAALLGAMRRYGDNRLLVVTQGAPGVVRAGDGWLRGRVSAFAPYDKVDGPIRTDEWVRVCRAAMKTVDRMQEQKPRPAALPDLAGAIEAGRHLHRKGDLAGAARIYQSVLNIDPDEPEALNLLAVIYHGQGDGAAAQDMLERAIRRAPGASKFANLAMVLNGRGQFADAVRAADAALSLRPAYAEALNNRGIAHAGQAHLAPAEADYRAALALRPDYAEARLNLAALLGQAGRIEEAEAFYRAAFALRPEWNPAATRGAGGRRRILYIGADMSTPGSAYRCERMARSAEAAGWQAAWRELGNATEADIAGLDVLLFWRVEMTPTAGRLLAYARAGGVWVGLDIDDLVIEPELARIDIVDGIRTTRIAVEQVRHHYTSVRHLLRHAHFGSCTTAELARAMRLLDKPVWVIANGFDADCHARSRRARRLRCAGVGDGVLRLGYAGGSRTHQNDMRVLVPALARVMAARKDVRLVLFRDPNSGEGLVLAEEFPELAALAARIEWRDMVPIAELPDEIARFDINLAPLEVGNRFVEAKSELKYFEAALCGVPTIASPTGPYRRAIRHGVNGFLADDGAAWEGSLMALIYSPELRARVARAAYHDALWRFGPERRDAAVGSMLDHVAGGAGAVRAHAAWRRLQIAEPVVPEIPASLTLFESDDGGQSDVTIAVSSYNYERFIAEALDSAAAQTLADLDLVVVDDCSSDGSLGLLMAWAARHRGRFHRLAVLRTARNAGLGGNRNVAFAWADTKYVFVLDADNRMRPECAARLLDAAQAGRAAFAYSAQHYFGLQDGVRPAHRFEPQRFVGGNYIDAMALIAKFAWAAAGGYFVGGEVMGWEDFDLWCRFVELDFSGVPVDEVLAEYRVHGTSMCFDLETAAAKARVVEFIEARHPWLDITVRQAVRPGDSPMPEKEESLLS